MTIINNFVEHKNWIDTCDVRIQLYWECTNSTLPSIVLESIWIIPISKQYKAFSVAFYKCIFMDALFCYFGPKSLWVGEKNKYEA